MPTYVMGDIHGEYDKYCRMLEKIALSAEDTLYVVGDVVDRGPQPMEILLDMMNRENVYPICGNHDFLALDMLKKLDVEITEENAETHLDVNTMNEFLDWMHDGGRTTMEGYRRLSDEQKRDVLDYLADFAMYEAAEVGDRVFILVHAGLGNFRLGKKISEYTIKELIMDRSDPDRQYFEDESIFVVTGHTPTLLISGKAEIYHSHNNICIDCGACMGGRLACICLDTMEEFYV